MESGWHLTKKVGGFCLQFILLTLICAYVCDTRVRFFLCFGAWSLSLADPPLVCDTRASLSHVGPCSLSALGRHQAALSFPSSLLTRGLGVLICKAGRIAERQASATLCGKD